MKSETFIAYYRVSTGRQVFGYSLEAQRAEVHRHVDERHGALIGEYSDALSGRRGSRPGLAEALKNCRLRRAKLIVARLDRLSRNVNFTAALMESGQEFVAVDFPQANKFTLHILAAIAEYESTLISQRVKAALEAARARGVRIGQPKGSFPGRRPGDNSASVRTRDARSKARARDLGPIVWDLVASGHSRKSIAGELDRLGIKSARGKSWGPSSVDFVMRQTRQEFGSTPQMIKAVETGARLIRSGQRTAELAPLLWGWRSQGMTLEGICAELMRRGVPTRRKGRWHTSVIHRLLKVSEAEFRALATVQGPPVWTIAT